MVCMARKYGARLCRAMPTVEGTEKTNRERDGTAPYLISVCLAVCIGWCPLTDDFIGNAITLRPNFTM